jgi:hypothetical protein
LWPIFGLLLLVTYLRPSLPAASIFDNFLATVANYLCL